MLRSWVQIQKVSNTKSEDAYHHYYSFPEWNSGFAKTVWATLKTHLYISGSSPGYHAGTVIDGFAIWILLKYFRVIMGL